ncbi:hypothetical protein NP493_46g01100 [Ridgeia piscesae]|uniref:G-protein coupled receptors family 1 profile domain-containing protein n=1 Tax=Ridgeia piscesae TaxID=27915 RepID=A0AAD9PBU1_RIDPI|nr:hypothetical protein NP493_46g01100 [Ridgeia piscesae]
MADYIVMFNWSEEIRIHIDDPDFDILRHSLWRGLVVALYVFIIVLGIVGNSIVIYIVAKNAKMRNVTNLFIASLSVSDIILCVFSLPLQLHYQLTDQWVFGGFLCHAVFAAFAVPMYTSTLTIFLIALDRYWLIVHPLTDRMRKRTAMLLLAVSILLPVAVSIPIMLYTSLHVISDPTLRISRTYCIEDWPSDTGRKLYSILTFTFQFCVPLVFTTILYFCIWSRLKQRSLLVVLPGSGGMQKTTKILTAIVVVFILCWLPWNMFSLVTELNYKRVHGAHFKLIDVLLKLVAKSSSSINPLLYCWLNENFRKELNLITMHFQPRPARSGGTRSMFRRCKRRRSRQHSQSRYHLQMGVLQMGRNLTLIGDATTTFNTTDTTMAP